MQKEKEKKRKRKATKNTPKPQKAKTPKPQSIALLVGSSYLPLPLGFSCFLFPSGAVQHPEDRSSLNMLVIVAS